MYNAKSVLYTNNKITEKITNDNSNTNNDQMTKYPLYLIGGK